MRKPEPEPTAAPEPPADRMDVNRDAEAEAVPTRQGSHVQERSATTHPVERVYAVLHRGGNTDDYVEAIRGR